MVAALSLMDLWMDFCVLLIAQLIFGALRPRRLLLAQCFLCACTIAAQSGLCITVWEKLAVLVVCAALLADKRRPLRILETSACLLCGFAVCGGLAQIHGFAPVVAPAGAILLLVLTRKRRNKSLQWNIKLYVASGAAAECFPALIDTGNRLHERRNGLPVLIVEAGAIPKLAAHAHALPAHKRQTLPFGVLGGSGKIECFRPDKIEILMPGWPPKRAPACWIGIFEGRIPGPTRALAPPEFADAIAPRADWFPFKKSKSE